MNLPPKALLAWSGGKGSAWALHLVRQSAEVEVAGLLTAFTEPPGRVSMHGVREELVAAQAAAAGLPLRKVPIPAPCSQDEHDSRLRAALQAGRAEGLSHVVFGDLYLADGRELRERQSAAAGLVPVFPLWHRGTALTTEAMILAGLKARVVSVDLEKLPRAFCGREYDEDLVCDLPPSVDPCGANGEFRTFCYGGPMFSAPLAVRNGETIERDGFAWTEIVLEQRS